MHFTIFIPHAATQKPPTLGSVGLGHLEANSNRQDVLDRGPDGGPGSLFSWCVRSTVYEPQNWDFYPAAPLMDEQGIEWAHGRYWVGMKKGDPPRPSELQRHRIFEGPLVVLADGFPWMVAAGARLPHVYRLNLTSGEVEPQVRREFADYFRKTQEWFLQAMFQNVTTLTRQEVNSWWGKCVEALSMNYRLVPEVVSVLDLIESPHMLQVAKATVEGYEIELVEEELKKKE